MEHLARLNGLDRLAQRFLNRLVVFAAVPGRMHDNDAETQFLEIVLELEAAVECEEDIKVSLGQLNKLVVGGALPLGLALRW